MLGAKPEPPEVRVASKLSHHTELPLNRTRMSRLGGNMNAFNTSMLRC